MGAKPKSEQRTDRLDTYRAKRDPAKTPEPMGRTKSRRGTAPLRFVIQEHHARSLHWDLRLEHDGVMASWALPKGLPDDPARNHLAVHTEDHPMEYNSFQGDIPRGEYGAGSVTIWDQGHYDVEKWSDSEVKFVLHGARASGGYVLFQTKDRDWMIHRHGPATLTDPVPTSIAPMLAVQGPLPEGRTEWAYEVKWDGARAIAFAEGGRVSLRSRNGKDVTATFPDLAHMAEHLGMSAVILDGEILALGDDGRPSFARLQNRLHVGDPRRRAAGPPRTRSTSSPSTSSTPTGGRSWDCPTTSVGRGSRRSHSTGRTSRRRSASATSPVRTCSGPSPRTGWRAWWPSDATPSTAPAGAPRTG